MSKVLLKDIDPRLQKQVAAAEQALRTNPQYAAEIAQGVLQRHPSCVEVRRLLRKAQKIQHGTKGKGLGGLLGRLTSVASLRTPSKLVETNPEQAIDAAEKMLEKHPADVGANRTLAAAAEKLGWYSTAAFAYEEICSADPKNIANYLAVGTAYLKDEDFDSALRAMDNGLKIFPGNGELQDMARRASVAKTMNQGKWEGDGDFKSKLKSEKEALEMQKSERVMQDADDAALLVQELEKKIAADPENVDYYREAVRNYQTLGNLEKAIETLRRARKTNIGAADAALEKQENELSMKLRAQQVAGLREKVEANPEDAELKAQYESAAAEEKAHRLQVVQGLVERYPNDYGYRYDYGVLLLEAGRNDEAIQQLQVAQRNPKNRHQAMLYLARAFINGNKFDLAADQLQVAKGEIQTMSDIKKDIIYELGNALEKMGRTKDAIEEYKVIYMADSAFKDVSQKINAFYESNR